jgi:hypothetical protein
VSCFGFAMRGFGGGRVGYYIAHPPPRSPPHARNNTHQHTQNTAPQGPTRTRRRPSQ